jgi:hypothetical protein
MTRMTKQINLVLLSAALTLTGCGQHQPKPPIPARVQQEGDWGDEPPEEGEQQPGARHASHRHGVPPFIILGGGIGAAAPPGGRAPVATGRPTGTTSTRSGGSTSTATSRGGFGGTGHAISGGSSS